MTIDPFEAPGAVRLLAASRSASAAEVARAKVICAVADGMPCVRAARSAGLSERCARKWLARFRRAPDVHSLRDLPRSGRPPVHQLIHRVAVVKAACTPPEPNNPKTPHRRVWTHASLSAAVLADTGVKFSVSEIGKILRRNGLKPHLVRQWIHTPDAAFDEKAKAVCDVYLNSPPGTVVLSIDEKPLQAIERRFPTHAAADASLRKEFEYVRHGTCALLCAFETKSGFVHAKAVPHRTADALEAFVTETIQQLPAGCPVVIVWDNLNTHCDGPSRRWSRLSERFGGRVRFVRTPIHSSWLNQVECWFSILQRRVIRDGSFKSTDDIGAQVLGFVGHWNAHEKHPFRWTWRVDMRKDPRRPEQLQAA